MRGWSFGRRTRRCFVYWGAFKGYWHVADCSGLRRGIRRRKEEFAQILQRRPQKNPHLLPRCGRAMQLSGKAWPSPSQVHMAPSRGLCSYLADFSRQEEGSFRTSDGKRGSRGTLGKGTEAFCARKTGERDQEEA